MIGIAPGGASDPWPSSADAPDDPSLTEDVCGPASPPAVRTPEFARRLPPFSLTLFDAIQHRRQLLLHTPTGVRVIHPHIVFVSTAGYVLLEAWQVFGPSRSGHATGWKRFYVDDIIAWQATGAVFEPAPGYRPYSTYQRGLVLCRLEPALPPAGVAAPARLGPAHTRP